MFAGEGRLRQTQSQVHGRSFQQHWKNRPPPGTPCTASNAPPSKAVPRSEEPSPLGDEQDRTAQATGRLTSDLADKLT